MTLSSSFGGTARGGVPPLEVRLLRNGIVESRHRVHAVVCDGRGRVLMRAGDGQNAWMRASDILRIGAQTAGDNHLAVLMQRLTNRLKTFRLGAVKKAAGVDNDRLCAGVIGADGIALRA